MDSVTSFDDYSREENFNVEKNCFTFSDKEVDINGEAERDNDSHEGDIQIPIKIQGFWLTEKPSNNELKKWLGQI